ncbi:GNAT family N-acetyltransferase [Peribacillus acanthi]|uniref:GNAT family N-acetyltransferase n=1 Tax=Peribacillus acanthi TaxID=2171554 RepID=UPI000D3E9412|nr:GNAT family N-acetyltransferase [Peribacillus acanthi]
MRIQKINEEMAMEILQWKYEPPYDFYNNEATPEALAELLENNYQGIISSQEELIGFFCTGTAAQVPSGALLGVYEEKMLDIGLGMKPVLTGNGKGTDFFSFVINTIQKQNESIPLRLTVASFNQRAIHLYKKFGFVHKFEFTSGPYDFMTMIQVKTHE